MFSDRGCDKSVMPKDNVVIQYQWGENDVTKTSELIAQSVRPPAHKLTAIRAEPLNIRRV